MKIAGILNSDNYMEFSLRVAELIPKTLPISVIRFDWLMQAFSLQNWIREWDFLVWT